jgi:parvulin-like peptidyl-prolyl isomerase
MALVRRPAVIVLGVGLLASGLVGCAGTGSDQARDENRKMDCLTRCGKELERQQAAPPILVARSQGAGVEELPPVRLGTPTAMPPASADPGIPAEGIRAPDVVAPAVTPAGGPGPALPASVVPLPTTDPSLPPPPPPPPSPTVRMEGDTQVRIVASIGNTPIYESEVREAVYQRMGELMRLPEGQRATREKEMFKEELRKIIDRELVIDELTATLTKNKQQSALGKLREAAGKEAEQRLKDFKKERGIPSDEVFREALQAQGLTLSGIRRQIERGFMMQAYLRERMLAYMDKIGLSEVREYYASHPDEFQAEDRVKWQDLFVLFERFKSADEARQYAAALAARAAQGADFGKLAAEYGMGDSKFRNGAGIGEKPGEIFPADLEPTILALNAGQITVKETEAGLHILRVAERTRAGLRPYDEKLQAEVKRKLQNQVYDREVRRMLDGLWKRTQPQIWVEG